MADVQLYLYEADKDRAEATRLAGETAKSAQSLALLSKDVANLIVELESKQLKLVDLIQSLGEYLNNEEAALRIKSMDYTSINKGNSTADKTKALAYLAEVLAALPTKVLSRQQSMLI